MSEYSPGEDTWGNPTLVESFDLIIDYPTILGPEELVACADGADNADTVIIRMGERIGQHVWEETQAT